MKEAATLLAFAGYATEKVNDEIKGQKSIHLFSFLSEKKDPEKKGFAGAPDPIGENRMKTPTASCEFTQSPLSPFFC